MTMGFLVLGGPQGRAALTVVGRTALDTAFGWVYLLPSDSHAPGPPSVTSQWGLFREAWPFSSALGHGVVTF